MITVKAGGYYDQPFTVTNQNATVSGSFSAAGGSGNDIEVYIMTDMDLTNWANGHQSQSYYQSGRVTVGNISASLSSGNYHLVFSNKWSIISSKNVNTTVTMTWYQ